MRLPFTRPLITGIIIIAVGTVMLVAGIWLAKLGGSWYYWIAGAALLITGAMLLTRRVHALWVYAALLLGTTLWAFSEAGMNAWRLMPRLLLPILLGIWLCTPWVRRKLDETLRSALATRALAVSVAISAVVWLASFAFMPGLQSANTPRALSAPPVQASASDDWQYYGRTPAGDRYSPLAQITPQNVQRLQRVWTFRTGDMPSDAETRNGREFNFENTPIKVGNSLYLCTPHRWIYAIDATTGEQRWKFKPETNTSANAYFACRGVSYYEKATDATCPRRIISTTADARLFALNADTGQLCPQFGVQGYVSLREHMGPVPPGFHFITSPPLVIDDRIVLGGWVYDNQTVWEPSGVVRAFDATSGALAWAWDLGKGNPTAPLGADDIYTRGTPNGWGAYTADPQLGLIYVPLGNATPDYWGGERRPFDDEYSSALVALDVRSGEERWHFQTVHHDLWDFDLPVGPALVDVQTSHGVVPALVQSTKLGDLFMLDRRTGQPIATVEEQSVPTETAPGDHVSRTQPRSVGMPTLAPARLTESDAWGATPLDQLWCRIQFRQSKYDGPFLPPSQQGNIAYPAFDGVVDWYGVTIDPVNRLLIANSSYIPFRNRLIPQADAIAKDYIEPWSGWSSGQTPPKPKAFEYAPQYGTPFAAHVKPWLNFLQLPCNSPPWGMLTAIDLDSRQVRWQRPLGTTRDTGPLGVHFNLPLHTGIFNIGGNIVTAGGTIFIAATADQYLRAFDEANGKKLWESRLPAGGQATPMTYLGEDGRQYIVIAAGGHGGLRTRAGDYVVAYALPSDTGRTNATTTPSGSAHQGMYAANGTSH